MEGGKQMGNNKLLKNIFVLALTFILICLSIIIAGELPDDEVSLSNEIDYSKLKYEVLNKNKTCDESLEELFRTNHKIYYTYCQENVYIKWENGEIDLLAEALIEDKILIEDLDGTNVEIVVEDINEN